MTVRRFDVDDYLIIFSWVQSHGYLSNFKVSLLVMTILVCELVAHNITRFVVAPLDDVMLNLRVSLPSSHFLISDLFRDAICPCFTHLVGQILHSRVL
jgi:hypothetical protein